MMQQEVLEYVRLFVEENYLYRHPGFVLTDDMNLLEAGVIDSLGVIELVGEVEGRFQIPVRDIDVTEENFGSVVGVTSFVLRQQAEAA